MHLRALLASLSSATSTIPLSACLDTAGAEGEGTTVEIIPTNLTTEEVTLSVAVYSTTSERLLDHTYSLPPEHSDESQGVMDDVGYLTVSTGSREEVRHEYDPSLDIDCEGEDVQIMVTAERIEFAYSC